MWLKWSLPLILVAASASAQQAPHQQDILNAMRWANGYFMARMPDPGTAIGGNPSHASH